MLNADGRKLLPLKMHWYNLTLLHSERPKLYTILAFLSAIGLISCILQGSHDLYGLYFNAKILK